jgi:hypothetical protein
MTNKPIAFRHIPLFMLLIGLANTPRVLAQDLNNSPANTEAILKELDQISSKANGRIESRRSQVLSQIRSAAGSEPSSVNLYVSALENTTYKENHQGFLDWMKKSQDLLRNNSMQNASQLQMQYLGLALERSDHNDAFAQVPQYQAYLKSLAGKHFLSNDDADPQPTPKPDKKGLIGSVRYNPDIPVPESRALLNQSLSDSAVVHYFQIGDLLPSGDDFEPSAGNYQGILDKNIRVPLRKKYDQRLLSTWDDQIAQEAAAATSTGSKQQADSFNMTRLPNLLFEKAQDAVAIGQPNRAVTQIMQLIRSYPDNPSVKDWVQVARGLVEKTGAKSPENTPQITSTNAVATPSTKSPINP